MNWSAIKTNPQNYKFVNTVRVFVEPTIQEVKDEVVTKADEIRYVTRMIIFIFVIVSIFLGMGSFPEVASSIELNYREYTRLNSLPHEASLWNFPLKSSDYEIPENARGIRKDVQNVKSQVCPFGDDHEHPTFVFGTMNTGTNMMNGLINSTCEGKSKFLKKCDSRLNKHTPWYPDILYVIPRNIPFIVMTKDPLTWFNSMCKRSYSLNQVKQYMECTTAIFDSKWSFYGKEYDSILSFWEEYHRLILNNTFGRNPVNALLVRYEDVLLDTAGEMKKVCNHLGLEMSKNVTIDEGAYKRHGKSHGLKSSKSLYLNPGYRYTGKKAMHKPAKLTYRWRLEQLWESADQNLLTAMGYDWDRTVYYRPNQVRKPSLEKNGNVSLMKNQNNG